MAATMNFKSTCKFCGEGELAWVELVSGDTKKWVLFKSEKVKHLCNSTAKKNKQVQDKKQADWEKDVKKASNKKLKGKNLKKALDVAIQAQEEIKLEKKAQKVLNKMNEDEAHNLLGGVNVIGENPGAKKVKLIHATSLYQPVSASSVGSTYHVIAMWDGLNMACRVKVFTGYYEVSIRVEGEKYPLYKNLEMLSKFNVNNNYGSVHYNATTRIDANAVIYAFIGMITKPALTAMPNLSKLIGKD